MNDTQRLDLLDRLIFDKRDMLDIKHGGTFFTCLTQHQTAANIREAIDLIETFMDGDRCWDCEHPYKEGLAGCRKHRSTGVAKSDGSRQFYNKKVRDLTRR